jgi:hypothetical protein
LQPDVCVVETPFTDEDETTHDDDALLEAPTVDPSVVAVVDTVVPIETVVPLAPVVSVETVVSAGAPEAVPSAMNVPAHATAAKPSPAAIHLILPRTSGRSERRSYLEDTQE